MRNTARGGEAEKLNTASTISIDIAVAVYVCVCMCYIFCTYKGMNDKYSQ